MAPLPAEHVLGEGCWIERLHPRTRSRADLAIFCLSGRAHDPAEIRRAAILEIVKQLPSRVPSEAPTIRTLSFPISIALTMAELIRAAPADPQDTGGPDGDDACSGGRHGQGHGPSPAPGRVRRRPPRPQAPAY
ncbi:hypothetical protein D1007_57479 [Hordeum vulgare]|nr:hypothetical protein D1007_57479 [Hordeum vulgare]